MPLKLEEGQNIEMTLDTNSLNYQSRKNIGKDYFNWIFLVGGLKGKLLSWIYADLAIIVAALVISEWFLLALIPMMVYTFVIQFTWGDKLDDKVIWENKFVTQVDGVERK